MSRTVVDTPQVPELVTAGASVGVDSASLPAQSDVTGDVRVPAATAGDVVPRGRRWANIGLSLSWLQAGLLLAAVVFRGWSAGRWPLGNMYEFAVFGAFAVTAAFVAASVRTDVRWLGVLVSGFVLIDLGIAVLLLFTEVAPLVPALRSYWLAIHVTAAVLSTGGFTLGSGASLAYLAVERFRRREAQGEPVKFTRWVAARVPDTKKLDAFAYRVHAFTFPLWTFAVVAGAIWAQAAWHRYWGWDPKETWSFVIWVVYAAYLHARATAGWKGARAAWLSVWGFIAVLFNFFVVNILFVGLHSYSGL
ncbi:MAG: c-type cytochrome biogenesis protein CcsB [Actinobacteria bacterium]|nr:c-type cytochrome biogenesis protein CcsB [Actinomycetota bacterium]